MANNLSNFILERQRDFNAELIRRVQEIQAPPRLKESMVYSIESGGKRLRPILMMATCESFGGSSQTALPVATALEMVHTYSLIHDDLPAMDDDEYRRGKLTNHKAFDEATAILAGDGLLTYSFEIITNEPQLSNAQKIYLLQELAKASGPSGMVAGQLLDMQAEEQAVDLEALEEIHTLKTGQLIKYAVISGAYVAGAKQNQLIAMENFAYYLGLIFQVQDDILDITGDPSLIGKPVGSDEANSKSTYPKLLGLEGARQQKELYVASAKEELHKAGIKHSLLEELTDFLSNRDH